MNLYRVKPKRVHSPDHVYHWQLPEFYVVAATPMDAVLLAQTDGIKRMHKANEITEEWNKKVEDGTHDTSFIPAFLGAPMKQPPCPEFKLGSIKLLAENVAVDGL